jgi:hypothetical protein
MPSKRNWLFARGNLQDDRNSGVPQFPGDPASSINFDNSKGFVVGDTWTLSPNLINNLHYGFTRQGYASRGIGQGQYANFYNISSLYAETRTTIVDVPVHNIVDDLILIHKAHTGLSTIIAVPMHCPIATVTPTLMPWPIRALPTTALLLPPVKVLALTRRSSDSRQLTAISLTHTASPWRILPVFWIW